MADFFNSLIAEIGVEEQRIMEELQLEEDSRRVLTSFFGSFTSDINLELLGHKFRASDITMGTF